MIIANGISLFIKRFPYRTRLRSRSWLWVLLGMATSIALLSLLHKYFVRST